MVEITNPNELETYLQGKIIKVLEGVGKEVAKIMIEELNKSKIFKDNSSMHTFAKYVEVNSLDNSEISIGVNFDKMSEIESIQPETETNERGEEVKSWGRFTNTWDSIGGGMGERFWRGEPITLRLAEWLNGDRIPSGILFGNQPLGTNDWFDNIEKKVTQKMPSLINKYLRLNGIRDFEMR